MADPALPTVLSFGKVVADGAINVVRQCHMEGTFRTFDEQRSEAYTRMRKMAVLQKAWVEDVILKSCGGIISSTKKDLLMKYILLQKNTLEKKM
jgi:hypothetical protein